MDTGRDLLCACVNEDSGQDMVEYALIVVLVAFGSIAGLHSLANVLTSVPDALMQMFWTAYTS